MADLRAGSTIGGRPIASVDMIEMIVSKEQIQDWSNKRNKFDSVLNSNVLDSYIQDKTKNGLYELNNVAPAAGMHNLGTLLNESGDNSRFQLVGTAIELPTTQVSALYFRTGWGATLREWERVATYNYVDSQINTRLPIAGGTVSGALTVSGLLKSSSNIETTNGLLRSAMNGNTVQIGSANAQYCHFNNSANIPFHFNKDIRVQGELYAGASYNQKVWHAGNFDATAVITKSTQLANNTDLNTVINEGSYRVYQAVNRPDKVTGWGYVEVIYHSDAWILQKIYNFEGTLSYMRTKTNGTWMAWIPMGGGMTSSKTIASVTEWTAVNNMYEMTITHGLGSENILSVVLTDSGKYSMNIGFQVIDINKIKVFCGENPTGKIVINATV